MPLVIKGICLFSEWPSPSVRNSFSLTRRTICMYLLQALAVQVPRGSYNRGMRWSSIVHITLKNNREQVKIGVRRERSCEHLPGRCCNKRPSVQAPSPRRRSCRTKPQKFFPGNYEANTMGQEDVSWVAWPLTQPGAWLHTLWPWGEGHHHCWDTEVRSL